MSPGNSQRLAELIDSVADGSSIDWDAVEAAAEDDGERRLLAVLRMVAGVAEVHRSDPPAAGPEQTVAAPRVEPVEIAPAADGSLGHWGHFQLLQKLGEGAFGEVYHARDTWLDHSVAVKLLKPALVDRARFLHEARTLARIRHANVVAIHGADEHDGRLGFWMEFIDGHTLAQVVEREGARSASEAALIGQHLCQAMAAVHAANIVHRDIKAQNVIRQSGTGRIVLMDFGAGEAMDAERAGRRPRGTPLYLAPELFDGSAATRETDIYALGVLLFNLVTRSYPVYGATVDELVRAHRRNARHHLGDMRPDLPDDFVRVVETMLAIDSARRYHSASEARKALEEIVAPQEIVIRPSPVPVPWWERALKWAGAVVVVLLGFTTMGFVSTAAFNVTLGRGDFGAESPLEWGVWGLRALVAPALDLTIYTIAVMVVAAGVRVLCRLFPPIGRTASSAAAAIRSFFEARKLDDWSLLLQVTAGLGALALALLVLYRWDDATIFAMYVDNAPADRLAALRPANEPNYDVFPRLVEAVLFAYGLAAHAVYTNAGRAGVRIPAVTTTYVLAVPVIALLLMRAVPYRVVYQNAFERVDYGNVRCYDLGRRERMVRLFCPDESPPRIRDKAIADPELRDRSIRESVFTPLEEGRVFPAASP
jgi:predicted Ser/Thr protein kinase